MCQECPERPVHKDPVVMVAWGWDVMGRVQGHKDLGKDNEKKNAKTYCDDCVPLTKTS